MVVYLRVLHEPLRASAGLPADDLFPLIRISQLGPYLKAGQAGSLLRLLRIELLREAATIAMLAAVAAATRMRWLPCFAIAFGVWDLTFYAALWRLIGWPSSPLTWDVLFLIPVPWVAPVLAPCIVAASIVTGGILCLMRPVKDNWRTNVLLGIGGAIILLSFTWDWRFYFEGGIPQHFPWWMFGIGEALGIAGLVLALTPRSRTASIGH